jgi:DNA invertase Pin-like site-specific DNA recombinase
MSRTKTAARNGCEGQDHEHWWRRPPTGSAAACATLEARPIAAPDRLCPRQHQGQELERQIRALKAERCDEIFKDTASGRSLAGRPQLRKALDSLAPGDELVIAEWDRATRSMWDGLQILKEIIDAEATIRVLDRAYIDLTSPIGRGFMAFISAMAEDERLRIIKRTHEGRAIARQNGVKMGRKFRLNDVQRSEARQRLANGEAASHLAKVYGVSRATIYRV